MEQIGEGLQIGPLYRRRNIMGFFSSIGKAFGIGNDAGNDAANQIQAANAAATKTRREAFGQSEAALGGIAGQLTPFIGQAAQGATAGGLDQRLGDIFGSQNFQNLVGERTRAVQGQLGAAGLTRSGTALQEVANVPTELGFNLENQLFNRQSGLATQGINQRINIENLRQSLAGNVAGLQQSTGRAQSQGILTDAQSSAAGIGNLLNLAGGIATGGLSTLATGALQQFGQSFQPRR